MKNWSNFYTPEEVAGEIIKLIPEDYSPNYAIDICAGSGNFLNAASNRWDIETIGVDIQNHTSIAQSKHKIYQSNALDLNTLKFLNILNKKIILANPPFGRLKEEIAIICKRHKKLQEEALRSKRIETNMIVSNMSLLKKGEIFAAILPENIFSSLTLNKFKNLFLSYFEIMYLSDPKRYFKGSEVMTRIFIGRYTGGIAEEKIFSNIMGGTNSHVSLVRGVDNSLLISDMELEDNPNYIQVIHFNNADGDVRTKKFVENNVYPESKKINKGDILISRVGRNSGLVHQCKSDFIGKYFSDYFYLLKGGSKLDLELLQHNLLEKKKGLTAKYICKKDILEALEKAS